MFPRAAVVKYFFRRKWTAAVFGTLLAVSSGQGEPQLNGQHLRITALQEGSFLDITEGTDSGLHFSGFLINMLEAIASKANFTYELLTPSGFGSDCIPRLNLNATRTDDTNHAYLKRYHTQYNCGTNDVNDLQGTKYGTDIYLGMFYISIERQQKNWFTIPFQPPFKGTPGMYGTATRIPTIQELARQQALGKQPPACLPASSATLDFVQDSFPDLKIKPFFGGEQDIYESMLTGECPIHIVDAPIASQFVLKRSQAGECFANGSPIGVIGEPMDSGLSHFAIGIGKHVDRSVVDTMSHWINVLMVDGTLRSFYEGQGGTGKECGYVLYPSEQSDGSLLAVGGIIGVALGAMVVAVIPLYFWYSYRLRQQEKRYKKRFVQQIARNIEIGRQPGSIHPEKLSEEVLHIGQGKEYINKADLSKWMHDIKMDFISQKDFDALWNAMDVDRRGEVSAVEFVVFLSACGPQFEEVYKEQEKLPKMERLKLAARRLSTLSIHGELGVRDIERRLERNSDAFSRRELASTVDSSISTTCGQSSRLRLLSTPEE